MRSCVYLRKTILAAATFSYYIMIALADIEIIKEDKIWSQESPMLSVKLQLVFSQWQSRFSQTSRKWQYWHQRFYYVITKQNHQQNVTSSGPLAFQSDALLAVHAPLYSWT